MNGDSEQPTETTSLLGASRVSSNDQTLPPIYPTLSRIRDIEIQSINVSNLCPHALASRAAETAYTLIILLQLRTAGTQAEASSRDIWDDWSRHREDTCNSSHLDGIILEVWSQFLCEYRARQDIEETLWLAFPYKEDSHRVLRVVDFLGHSKSPPALISHRAIQASIMRTWKYGRKVQQIPDTSLGVRILQRYDAICTPRVAHGMDLICQLVFLGLLANFIVYPPRKPIIISSLTSYGMRETLLVLYSLSTLVRSWTPFVTPFLIVFFSFAACLPITPFPGDNSFNVLLIALALLLLQLHLPRPPTPLLIFPVYHTLPLSTFLSASSGIFLPVLMFFVPVIIVTTFLLSVSLADAVIPVLNTFTLDPAPMETRIALLALLAAELVIFCWCLFVLATSFSSFISASSSTDQWDQYSQPIGADARRIFLRIVVNYASPHHYPPPFNLISFVFMSLPSAFLHLTGKKGPSRHLAALARILWRIVVAPFAFLVAGIWLWGLRG